MLVCKEHADTFLQLHYLPLCEPTGVYLTNPIDGQSGGCKTLVPAGSVVTGVGLMSFYARASLPVG